MSFSCSDYKIPAIFHLNQHQLMEVTSVKDLGFTVNNKLNFAKLMDKITSQAYRILGFIFRSGREFSDGYTLIRLFTSLVQPIVEYCTTIRSPHTTVLTERVEKIQKTFRKYVSYYSRTVDLESTAF